MIGAEAISEILSLYSKHGWILRRVLVSEKLSKEISAQLEIHFGDAEIVPAEIDAVLFSRDSGDQRVAWELRHLSANPFAVFETFGKEIPENVLRENLREMEERLKNRLSRPK